MRGIRLKACLRGSISGQVHDSEGIVIMARNSSDFMVRARGPTFGRDVTMQELADIQAISRSGAELEVSVRLVDGFAVLRLGGPTAVVDGEGVGRLRAHLTRLFEEGHVRQVLDLGGVECASAPLVTCLVCHHRRLQEWEGTFRLHGVGTQLASALSHCGLLGVLEVYENEENALRGWNRQG